jgi:type VI protein secretion system component VasF
MESDWEEKKIQALYSEARSADEQSAPRFATVWNRAQLGPRRSRLFKPVFVAATISLVFALVSLAVWSRYSPRTEPSVVANTPPASIVEAPPAPVTATTETGAEAAEPAPRAIKRARPIRLRAQRNALVAAQKKLQLEAKAITNWESPTSALLTSPSDEIFSSLPELNKNASELKSFLPSRAN